MKNGRLGELNSTLLNADSNRKNNRFPAYYNNNLSVSPSKITSTGDHNLPAIPQIC